MAILFVFHNGRENTFEVQNGYVFKLIESLLLLPVDFLIIFLKWPPMKMHDASNINECGSTSKTNVVS